MLCNHSLELHQEQDSNSNTCKVTGAYAEVQCCPRLLLTLLGDRCCVHEKWHSHAKLFSSRAVSSPCPTVRCTDQRCVPASRPGEGRSCTSLMLEQWLFPCVKDASGISMVDISIISNTRTEGISVLASIVELSVGNQRRNCCYVIAS